MASRGTQGACLQDAYSLLQDHGVDARFGLSHAAAAAAMKRHGPNELSAKEEDPMWKRFADKLKEPMIVLLLISAGLSILIGQYDDAVSITLAVLIVITVACVQEYKSDQSLAALSKLAPHGCHVRRDGRLMDVEASQLVPGDILVIAAGDRVPADLRLLECVDLAIDESSLTGENEPSEKTADVLAPQSTLSGPEGAIGVASGSAASAAFNVPIADRRNCAFMGTLVSSGRGLGLVIDTGMATELGGIMATMEEAEERKSPLQQKMDALSQRLATISFVIIGGITLVGLLERKPLLEMFTIGVSLAVAAIPEGLPIVVTVTLALGVQRMALKRAVVKKLPAVESLGCTSVLAMDKTGTLTRNEQTVVEAFTLATPSAWQGAGLAAGTLPGRSASGNALADGSSLLAPDSAGLGGASGALWRQAAADPVAAHHLLHDSVLGRGGLVGGARILFSGLGYNPSGGGAVYSAPRATGGGSGSSGGGGVGSGIAAVTGAKSFSALHDLLPQQPITATADQHVALLLEAATVCNNADIRLTGSAAGTAHSAVAVSVGGGGSQRPAPGAGFNAELSGQPTEGALLVAAAKIPLGLGAGSSSSSSGGAGADGRALASAATPTGASLGGLACAKHWYVRTAEAPFSSETKWMAVRGRYIPGAATSSAAGAGAAAGSALSAAPASTAASASGDAASGSDGLAAAAAAAGRSPTHRPSGSAHAALHAHIPGELIFAKGAVEAVLAMCDFAVVPSGHPQGIPALADALRGDGIRGLLQAQQRREGGLADAQSTGGGLPTHAAAATGVPTAVAAAGSGGSVFLPLSFSVAPLDVTMTAAVLAAAETMAREGLRVIAVAKGDQVPSQSRYSGGSGDRSAALRFGRGGGLTVAADGTGGTGVLPAGGSMLGASYGAASAAPPSPAHAAIGGMVFLGLLGLHDPPREGVIETLAILQEAGVRTCMITGDSMPTAISIATHLGLISEANRRTGASGHARQFSSGSGGGAAIVSSSGGASGVLASQPTPTTALAAGLGVLSPTTDQGAAHEVDIEAVQARERVALSGNEIDAMSEEELAAVVRSAAVRVFYRTTPKHKMKLVHAFQRAGHVVAMTGDGINDSIALKVADIGVAMGRGGTDVAKEAADVVLLDDDLRTLIPAIEEGKGIFYNIRNFVRFQLSTSVAALALVAICTILQLPQPLNAMQILWINIIMDGPPAQSLGVEPVGKEVLRQPPRAASESIITWKLLRRILVAALTVVIGTLLVLRSEMATSPAAAASAFATAALGTGGAAAVDSLTSGTGAAVATALAETGSAAGSAIASAAAQALQAHARHATTMTFTTFVMFDMFNALSCRSMERSLFALNFLGNKVFLWAIGGSIAGQLAVIYFPPLQAVFQTAPLSAADWLRILVTASAVLWVDEGMKLLDSGVFARLLAGGGSGRRYRTPPQYFRAQTV